MTDGKKKIRALKTGFPHVLGDKQEFPEGIAIFSKIPFLDAEYQQGSLGESTYARIKIHTPDSSIPVVLYNIHAISPMQKSHWYMRNFNLLDIAHEVSKELSENKIVLGDFNTTQWSHWFKKVIEISSLRDAQQGRGYNISWSPIPYKPLWGGLHIDQMLISKTVEIINRSFGPDLGSDHLPIVTELGFVKRKDREYVSTRKRLQRYQR